MHYRFLKAFTGYIHDLNELFTLGLIVANIWQLLTWWLSVRKNTNREATDPVMWFCFLTRTTRLMNAVHMYYILIHHFRHFCQFVKDYVLITKKFNNQLNKDFSGIMASTCKHLTCNGFFAFCSCLTKRLSLLKYDHLYFAAIWAFGNDL